MSQDECHDLGPITAKSRAVAASVAMGRELLGTRDAFVAAMTPFDRQARVEIEPQALVVDGGRVCQSHAMPSSAVDGPRNRRSANGDSKDNNKLNIAGMALRLPERVWFVKTSGREEGNAAYTRNSDTVVLPAAKLAAIDANGADALHPVNSNGLVESVTTHELFHIQSKYDPSLRKRLYPVIHYRLLDRPVTLPDVPAPQGGRWPDWKITNPDAPLLDVYIELCTDDQPPGPRRPMTPVLLSRSPYSGGRFFDYIEWSFLVIEFGPDGPTAARAPDGGPLLVPSSRVLQDYRWLIGRNFDEELFHPDEILAQNFVLAVQEPSLDLLVQLRSVLTQTS